MKKLVSLFLVATLCIMSLSVFAAETKSPMEDGDAPLVSNLETYKVDGKSGLGLKFKFDMTMQTMFTCMEYPDERVYLAGRVSVNGGEWQEVVLLADVNTNASTLTPLNGKVIATDALNIKESDKIEFYAYFHGEDVSNWTWEGKHSEVISLGAKEEAPAQQETPVVNTPVKAELICSDWAKEELAKAEAVIPESLKTADLTKNITRAEFAAVAVKAYEALKGTKAQPVATNPFKDTNDAEVLKAFNIGITTGTSETTFEPSALLNREQAATMLTRAYSKDKVNYEKPATFADDAQIDDWAKDSVYFMASKGIINGVGENKFAPDESCSREQAIIIAARMVANLK
ncbi:MAG: S-layer homology domain-containing protein [Clostridia bacterium]|nr:S-layer homology domain-containing protein [Clostridia bacterium]